nr:hypothetical protein [Morchella crassipes]
MAPWGPPRGARGAALLLALLPSVNLGLLLLLLLILILVLILVSVGCMQPLLMSVSLVRYTTGSNIFLLFLFNFIARRASEINKQVDTNIWPLKFLLTDNNNFSFLKNELINNFVSLIFKLYSLVEFINFIDT